MQQYFKRFNNIHFTAIILVVLFLSIGCISTVMVRQLMQLLYVYFTNPVSTVRGNSQCYRFYIII